MFTLRSYLKVKHSQWKPVIQITYIILVKVKNAGGTNIFYHFFKRFGKHFALHQTRNDTTRYKYPFLQLIFVYNQQKKKKNDRTRIYF